MIPSVTSAIDILVPEADAIVGPYRRQYCFSEQGEMPPHITLLFPFKPRAEVTPAILDALRAFVSERPSFEVTLEKIQFFEKVAFLLPEPVEPLIELIRSLMSRFPECKPYGCDFREPPLPHLTFAKSGDRKQIERIAEEFTAQNRERFPLHLRVTEAYLTYVENGVSTPTVRLPFRR